MCARVQNANQGDTISIVNPRKHEHAWKSVRI